MIYLPRIDPVAISLGPLDIHWYGLMYVFAFFMGWILLRMTTKRSYAPLNPLEVDDLVTWIMLGVILGGRLGYVLFYDFAVYMRNPLDILKIWQGGMSFHGGLLGVMASIAWWSKRHHHSFLTVLDMVAPAITPGLLAVRIGNFINGELWGSITTSPFGVVFASGGPLPRHPSQLYEAFLEGLVLFIILYIYARKPRPDGHVSGLFAMGYATFRFGIEFVRQPDAHLGYLAFNWLTMGQILSIPLFLAGLWLMLRPTTAPQNNAAK